MLGLICATETDAVAARDAVGAALRCQRHRGPDETDTWADAEVVYSFNRLGFIDLEHSHQPLVWGPPEVPTRYTMNFNGEGRRETGLRKALAKKSPPVPVATAARDYGDPYGPAGAVWAVVDAAFDSPYRVRPGELARVTGGTEPNGKPTALIRLVRRREDRDRRQWEDRRRQARTGVYRAGADDDDFGYNDGPVEIEMDGMERLAAEKRKQLAEHRQNL